MLCFTQIYQISYPSHISLLSALYSPSAYCPNFQDGPLPGPIGCPFLAARMYLPGPARCTFPDRLDAPSWADRMYLPGPTRYTFPDRPDIPSRTDPMYLPGPTRCTFPNGRMPLPALTGYPTPRRPSSARSQLQPYGCNHFSKKGDCTCGPFRLLYGWIVNNNAAEPQRG